MSRFDAGRFDARALDDSASRADVDVDPPARAMDGGRSERAPTPQRVDAGVALAPPLATPELTREPVLPEMPSDASTVADTQVAVTAVGPLPEPVAVCRAGAYTGVFAGEIRALLGIVRIDISGTLRFDLPAPTGEAKLTLRNGALEGHDADGHPIKATISGTLDCATGRLEGGRLTAGTYTRPDPLRRGRTATARFSGVTSGSFSGDPPTALGSWAVDDERNARSGSGSWSARLAP